MPKNFNSGGQTRTLVCCVCNRQYRGAPKTCDRLMQMHMRVAHNICSKAAPKFDPTNTQPSTNRSSPAKTAVVETDFVQ